MPTSARIHLYTPHASAVPSVLYQCTHTLVYPTRKPSTVRTIPVHACTCIPPTHTVPSVLYQCTHTLVYPTHKHSAVRTIPVHAYTCIPHTQAQCRPYYISARIHLYTPHASAVPSVLYQCTHAPVYPTHKHSTVRTIPVHAYYTCTHPHTHSAVPPVSYGPRCSPHSNIYHALYNRLVRALFWAGFVVKRVCQ